MPELPEVETIRRGLAARVEGRRLERLDILDPRFCAPAPPAELE
ncbi:MAG: DNA-formamidopyrimidine glycosylase, partial [Actinomycetota bacterium]|nr:DNA-formamidopyrimidine glycosylase [Actinomycetota bacterium]